MTSEKKNPKISQGKKEKERERGKTEKIKVNRVACQDCILSPFLYNLYAEYIMQNAGLDEAQAGLKIARKKSITSDSQMTPSLLHKAQRN